MVRREQSGGISHSERKDSLMYNRRREEDGAEKGGLVPLMVEREECKGTSLKGWGADLEQGLLGPRSSGSKVSVPLFFPHRCNETRHL